jgi:hypothetical protein
VIDMSEEDVINSLHVMLLDVIADLGGLLSEGVLFGILLSTTDRRRIGGFVRRFIEGNAASRTGGRRPMFCG